KDAALFSADMYNQMKQVGREIVTPEGQARLVNDPVTGPATQAVLSPINVLTNMGDTPIAQTERENRHKAAMQGIEYTPQGPMDPLMAEKLIGGGVRVTATGGAGALATGAVEAGARAADIAQNEPGRLSTLGGLGRVAVAGATAYIPMKAGAAIERAVAEKGLSGASAFIANALADTGIGFGAG